MIRLASIARAVEEMAHHNAADKLGPVVDELALKINKSPDALGAEWGNLGYHNGLFVDGTALSSVHAVSA